MYTIGIDLGTSTMKLLLVEETGEILNSAVEEYPLLFPHPGWSEQEPKEWWGALLSGVTDLLTGFDAKKVAGIGVGGQMHGLVTLDAHDNVIRPAILWNDGRTAEETEWLNTEIGKERLSAYTGNIAFAGFTAPKILWMQKHEPEHFAKIDKIMLPKDYLNYYDIRKGVWHSWSGTPEATGFVRIGEGIYMCYNATTASVSEGDNESGAEGQVIRLCGGSAAKAWSCESVIHYENVNTQKAVNELWIRAWTENDINVETSVNGGGWVSHRPLAPKGRVFMYKVPVRLSPGDFWQYRLSSSGNTVVHNVERVYEGGGGRHYGIRNS